MTLAGLCIMIGSLSGVVALTGYCFYQLLRAPEEAPKPTIKGTPPP